MSDSLAAVGSCLLTSGLPDGGSIGEVISNGKYQLSAGARLWAVAKQPIIFIGKDRLEAKRRALDYWYRTPRQAGLTLNQFLQCCRLFADDCRIAYYPPSGR